MAKTTGANQTRSGSSSSKPFGVSTGGARSAWQKPNGTPQVRQNMDYRSAEDAGMAAAYGAAQSLFSTPGGGTSGGGGGGGYGGGGGGGSTPAVTQAMIDAMAQALASQVPQLTYTPLPAYQGQALPAFSTSPYDTQRTQLNAAAARDQANFATNQAATTQAVQGAYSNPYASAQVQAGPATPQMGAGLMATAGGVTDPAMAAQMNQENAANQGSFQDLYRVLGANQQASQNSRMQQVAMDANYGRQTAAAQVAGMQGGIATTQAAAQQAWAQQQAERNYQNQLMAYQTQLQNAQGQQATAQANWTQQNSTMQARLQPILDLIAQSQGTSGLNFSALMAALQGSAA